MAEQKKLGNRLTNLPLGEHDFTYEAIAQQQGMTYELVSRKANKLNESLVREEVVLQKAEIVVESILEKLQQHPQLAKDKVEALQDALAHRNENERYLKDLQPEIKDAAKQLLTPHTAKDAAALMATIDTHSQYKLLQDKGLVAKAQRSVDERFGGYRTNEAGEKVRALTSEGMEQLLVRYPTKEVKASKHHVAHESQNARVADAKTAHIQDAMSQFHAKPSPDNAEVVLAQAATEVAQSDIKPKTRIGTVMRGSDGTIVHRGRYGMEL